MTGIACAISSDRRSPESGRPCFVYLMCIAQIMSSLRFDTPGSLAFFLPVSRPLTRARNVENMQQRFDSLGSLAFFLPTSRPLSHARRTVETCSHTPHQLNDRLGSPNPSRLCPRGRHPGPPFSRLCYHRSANLRSQSFRSESDRYELVPKI